MLSVAICRRLLAAVLALSCVQPLAAASKPHFDPLQPPALQPGPLAVQVPATAITRLAIRSRDGRPYVLWVAVLGKPPRQGYPLLLLLDGRAAIYQLLHSPGNGPLAQPMLLVAVGSPGPAYYDVVGRAYDYTPDPGHGEPVFDPRQPDRRAGGAEAFLATLLGPVQQALAARWPLDPQHRGLWGHSYGGLFTLYSLFRHGQAFQFYAPTSPSLWWYAPFPQTLAETYLHQPHPGPRPCVLLSEGTAEGQPARLAAPPSYSAEQLAAGLRPVLGSQLIWRPLPGLSHGETFGASLGPAIRAFGAWSAGAASCGLAAIK